MNYCVVIPSIRELPLEYLEPILDKVYVVVVDDSNGKAPRHAHPRVLYVDDAFQEDYSPAAAALVPHRNPSCKAFGLYYAWREGFDIAILLDDDVDLRVSPDFLDKVPVGKLVKANTFHSMSGWYNPMLQLGETEVWARGYPYEFRSESCEILRQAATVRPLFNEGLWTGTADINGVDKLAGHVATKDRAIDPGYVVLQVGDRLPLSIMNCQIHRDLIPAFYQPPDWPMPGGFQVRRHDDVWSMYVLKALMDRRLEVVTVGEPLAWHRKEGDMEKEILSEHYTNLVQPWLTQVVDAAARDVSADTYANMAVRLGQGMLRLSRLYVPLFAGVIGDYARRITQWATLFQEA